MDISPASDSLRELHSHLDDAIAVLQTDAAENQQTSQSVQADLELQRANAALDEPRDPTAAGAGVRSDPEGLGPATIG